MEEQKKNIIVEKSFQFSLTIINLYIQLKKEKEFVISKQLLRSGTSIGANIEEAQSAQSKVDFISKMNISLKEAKETRYWLRLLKESNLTKINLEKLLSQIDELIKLLITIINSSKQKH